jgi:chromate reductase
MYIIFVASLVENMKLASKIENNLKDLGKETEIINLVDLDIPMFDTFKLENDGIPEKIKELSKKMSISDGYIVVSPEYNYSIPPVLTNVIAWLSRSGDNFRELFTLKYIQLATHSGSGGTDVCNAMRTQFTKLGSIVVPREIITTYQKTVEEDSLNRILTQYLQIAKKA